MKKKKVYKIVDLFSGCGGISRGFEWTERFATEFAVEIEKHPANALKENLKNSKGEAPIVYNGDIRELADNKELLWKELNLAGIHSSNDVDVLVGGPPCQGFSRNGVRQYVDEGDNVRFYDDPRNHLYKAYLEFIAELQPSLVLIENVREFLNFGGGKFSKDLIDRLNEIGYEVKFQKVCAADYGVPQMRHRVLFIATHKRIIEKCGKQAGFPIPKYTKLSSQSSIFSRYRTVRDAIGDLPKPVDKQSDSPQEYGSNVVDGELASFLRSKTGMLHNHVARKLSKINLARINAVGTGRMKHVDSEFQTKKFYGSAYGRMHWDKPSLTITTWVYHVGSGRYAHPAEERAITMREAARIQTFDDDFIFPPLINPVSQMIGNAVPPMLAHEFAKEFLCVLDEFESTSVNAKEKVQALQLNLL